MTFGPDQADCPEDVRARFTREMLGRPRLWKEKTGLTHWSRFLQLVRKRDGIDAARILIHKPGLSDGFLRLKAEGALDLTVEYLVLQAPYDCCFNSEDRRLARKKLVENDLPRADLPPEPTCG